MICPCKDCENKGCGNYHSQCEKYLNFVKWKQEVNEKERNHKLKYFSGQRRKRRNKWKRKN